MTPSSVPASAPANRLIRATSPYLLQHAHNPVEWYEWGPEALQKARREDKPIFLSIGYSACHWCHVMAHESFENAEIAAVMNRLFVNVKVDREERPDLDEIYMQATLILNQGHGGWPMSVWLTPDLRPFFAGTYFPPDTRWGRPGFRELCERIGELWQTRREALLSDAERLTEMIRQSLSPAAAGKAAFTLEHIDRTADLLAGAFDTVHGGLVSGGTNKFPPSMAIQLLLRSAVRRGAAAPAGGAGAPASQPAGRRLLELVELTLDRMAHGGIYDQLGGGIARYSTDVRWLVPHFEKMLYDQALVSRAYIDAWQVTRNPLYARIAREIFDYVLGDLRSPEGGFYSARDADSEGQEGRYYVWTKDEVMAALGREDGELFCSYYDVTDAGNWHEPLRSGTGQSGRAGLHGGPRNILHVPRDLETVAKLHRLEPLELEQRLADARRRLLEVRSRRVPPARDEKILCEWNGLMITSLARGGCVLGERKYVDAAARAAEAILTRQYRAGRLIRSFRDGGPPASSVPGAEGRAAGSEVAFLSDYACLIEGLLELYEATFEKHWLERAAELNRTVIEHYLDREDGGFFFTPDDHETLIVRSLDVRDGAVPSGNSVQLMNLLRLSAMLGDPKLRELAERTMARFVADVLGQPGASERFLQAVEFALVGPVEIAIVGDPADPRTAALLRVVHETYLPNRVLMLLEPARPAAAPDSPLLAQRTLVGGAPAAYVCRGYACERPVTEPEELRERLLAARRAVP